ncbi:MAG TPA: hypothetical protein VLC49_13660 [Solirubrobacteraceae bacterium]|nr:hypothetical protein [Solirubrobacteraceae bacterium]
MIVGGVTEPSAAIVKRAGTRTLIAPVGVLAVVFVVFVVDVVLVCVVVIVAGGKVAAVVVVNEVEVDFEPPQPATDNAPKRTATLLTFAG